MTAPLFPAAPAGRGRGRSLARWLWVAGLLALAAVVRLGAVLYDSISGEDATVALMAKHMLRGEAFPVFFYRQTYMGSLNGAHLVPALWAFGPSVLLVRLHAIAWSLLFPLGLYVLARRLFDEATGRVALLLAAVPPFLLTYWSTVAEPHFEANTFGVVLLLLALAALDRQAEPARARALAVFGLVAGIGVWTTPKVLEVALPAVGVLVLRDPALLWSRRGALLAAGALAGSLPAWLWYLAWGDPAAGGPGGASAFLHPRLALSLERLRTLAEEVPLRLIGSYYWPPRTAPRQVALGLAAILHAAGLLGLAAAALAAARQGAAGRAWGRALLVLVVPSAFLALYVSPYRLDHEATRYVLPALIPLLVGAAALVVRLGRRTRLGAVAALAFLVGFHLWTHAGFLWPFQPRVRALRARVIAAREAVAAHVAARPDRALLVDGTLAAVPWAFLLDRPVVSALESDVYPPQALRADAAPGAAILTHWPEIEAELAAVGAVTERRDFDNLFLFDDARVPARAYRATPRAEWRVDGDPGIPAAVADGDAGTVWPPPRSPLRAFQVDLGGPRPLARLVAWPAVPVPEIQPIEVSVSVDGARWEPAGLLPRVPGRPVFVAAGRPLFRPRNGWLELALPGTPVRYLRFAATAVARRGEWGIAELVTYEDAGPAQEALPAPADLAAALRARGVERLLADPVVSARASLATGGAISILPANGTLDNHGHAPPEFLHAPVRLRPTDAFLVPAEDAPELTARLRALGVPATAEPVGSHRLFQPSAPLPTAVHCRRVRWRAEWSPLPEGWSRGTIEIALPETLRVAAVRLEHPGISTRHTVVEEVRVADAAGAWRAVPDARPAAEWAWGGRTLFQHSAGATEVALGDAAAERVRVRLRLPAHRLDAVRALCVRAAA